jgi:hypothetical protein
MNASGTPSTGIFDFEQIRKSLKPVKVKTKAQTPVNQIIEKFSEKCNFNANKLSPRLRATFGGKAAPDGIAKATAVYDFGQSTHFARKTSRSYARTSSEPYRSDISRGLDLARPSSFYNHQSRGRVGQLHYSKASITKKNPVFFVATDLQNDSMPVSSNSSVRSDAISESHSAATAPTDLECARSFESLSNWPSNFSPFNQASRFGDQMSIGNNDELFPSMSMQSDYTTDSDAYGTGDSDGDNRYLQITLSSGGITEKYEPNIVLSPTVESTDDSLEGQPQRRGGRLIDLASPTESSPEKYYFPNDDRRRSLEAFKGAKRFFFGGKKSRKTTMF